MASLFGRAPARPQVDMHVMVGGAQRSLKGEDSFHTCQHDIGGESTAWILVADGHGGNEVSMYLSTRIVERICTSAADGSADALHAAAVAAFQEAHAEVCGSKFDSGEGKAGSTLTICCVNVTRGEIHSWNVGDSMALLVYNDGYVEVGQTHRLQESLKERERVVAMGATLGRILGPDGQPAGPIRAFPGGLAVTRCIGDTDCGTFVVADPAYVNRPAPPMGGALLACSDGVWDHLSAEEVAGVLLEGRYSDGKSAAMQVVKKAVTKSGFTDDTTACVILFGPPALSPNGSTDVSKEGGSGGYSLNGLEAHPAEHANRSPPVDERRHFSFLRHVNSHPDLAPGSDNVLTALIQSEGGHRGMDSDDSVEVGRMFTNLVRFSDQLTSEERDVGEVADADEDRGAAERSLGSGTPHKMRRLPPSSTNGEDSYICGEDNLLARRASVRVPSDALFAVCSGPEYLMQPSGLPFGTPMGPPPGDRPNGSTPSFFRPRVPVLHKLFDHLIVGDKGPLRVPEDRNGVMDKSTHGDLDTSKHSGDSFSFGHSNPGHTPAPWSGVPGDVRRVVNASPRTTWSGEIPVSAATVDAPNTRDTIRKKRRNSVGTVRSEESVLRATLAAHGSGQQLPAAARTVEWASLESPMDFLGQGEFAAVCRTKLEGKACAVKMLKKSKQDSQSAVQGIKREIMLMTLMQHPNVLPAHALGQYEGKPFIIIELLVSVLDKELPHEPDTVPWWVRRRELAAWPLSRCLNCGLQLARALKYCHDDAFPGYCILHRDVKPNNIGFLANGDLVLFDFGISAIFHVKTSSGSEDKDAPRKLTGVTGSLRYMAPEVANSQHYNHKAEVFSFASVLWELCAYKRPYLEYKTDAPFKEALLRGVHPKINRRWPEALQKLFKSCWALNQADRPEVRDLMPSIETLLADALKNESAKRKKPPQPRESLLGDPLYTGAFSRSAQEQEQLGTVLEVEGGDLAA